MAQDTAHTYTRRAAEGQERTNTPWVGRTGATQLTHRASRRGGTPRPLVRARPGCIGDHGKRNPEPWEVPLTGALVQSPGRGSPAKQRGPATQATRVRHSYRRLAGAILLVVRDTPHGWAAPRAAAQRRGNVALPMATCGDTLPPGPHEPGGCDNAFPSTCRSGLRGA